MWLIKYFFCIVLARYCFSVGEEYFESEISFSKEATRKADSRRTGENTHLEKDDKISWQRYNTSVGNNESPDISDANLVFVKKMKPLENFTVSKINNILRNSTQRPTWKTENEIKAINNKENQTIYLFKEYEYLYDNDITTKFLKKNEDSISELSPSIISTERNENISSNFLPDFYSVEPAAVMPNPNFNYKNDWSNNWYVPEHYPCWHLPVIFGELASRKKSSDVFLISGATLKNVQNLDVGKSTKNVNAMPRDKNPDIHNKWCGVEPCYGDHTLCLFPETKQISKICDSKYSVKKPIMSVQMALVNTINSMRNRIANGVSEEYSHLPPAANMKQIIYDYDLEKMSEAWLRQCLPGPAPCSALDGNIVTQLECTKYTEKCCLETYKNPSATCIPKDECFIPAIIGCIYTWFMSAKHKLRKTDVNCGHTNSFTYSTTQLFWAETNKVGCAYAERNNGDVRVVCNFAPGAPFFLKTQYYCGLIPHKDITHRLGENVGDITSLEFLQSFKLNLHPVNFIANYTDMEIYLLDKSKIFPLRKYWDLNSLGDVYNHTRMRDKLGDHSNGTRGFIMRLVTKYTFSEESEDRCDTAVPIYIVGEPGSLCVQKGRRFEALCYDFRDPTPGYRFVAVIAPVALFSLILYDLFSGVVRQTIS